MPYPVASVRGMQMSGGGGYSPAAMLASRVALWKLDEASGTRADSVGSNTLTDNNTVLSDTGLVYPLAAAFVAANSESLSIASNSSLQAGAFSYWFGGWFKPSGTSNQHLVSKLVSLANRVEYMLRITGGAFNVYVGTGAGGSNANVSTGTVTGGAWHLVLGRRDHANGLIGISVNGGDFVTTALAPSVGADTGSLSIGGNASADGMYNGLAGPVMVGKSYLLTNADAAYLHNAGLGRA